MDAIKERMMGWMQFALNSDTPHVTLMCPALWGEDATIVRFANSYLEWVDDLRSSSKACLEMLGTMPTWAEFVAGASTISIPRCKDARWPRADLARDPQVAELDARLQCHLIMTFRAEIVAAPPSAISHKQGELYPPMETDRIRQATGYTLMCCILLRSYCPSPQEKEALSNAVVVAVHTLPPQAVAVLCIVVHSLVQRYKARVSSRVQSPEFSQRLTLLAQQSQSEASTTLLAAHAAVLPLVNPRYALYHYSKIFRCAHIKLRSVAAAEPNLRIDVVLAAAEFALRWGPSEHIVHAIYPCIAEFLPTIPRDAWLRRSDPACLDAAACLAYIAREHPPRDASPIERGMVFGNLPDVVLVDGKYKWKDLLVKSEA